MVDDTLQFSVVEEVLSFTIVEETITSSTIDESIQCSITEEVILAPIVEESILVTVDETLNFSFDEVIVQVVPTYAHIYASEDLTAGDYVNVYNVAGAATARKASALSYTTAAKGYVLLDTLASEIVVMYTDGTNNKVTDQLAGTVYLSEVPGVGSASPPNTVGSIVQEIGVATKSTEVCFSYGIPVELG